MSEYFKDEYDDLVQLLQRSHKHIVKSFGIGAPEGPPIIEEVYQLKMDCRKTTESNPSKATIKSVLTNVISYFKEVKQTDKIKTLMSDIEKYLEK